MSRKDLPAHETFNFYEYFVVNASQLKEFLVSMRDTAMAGNEKLSYRDASAIVTAMQITDFERQLEHVCNTIRGSEDRRSFAYKWIKNYKTPELKTDINADIKVQLVLLHGETGVPESLIWKLANSSAMRDLMQTISGNKIDLAQIATMLDGLTDNVGDLHIDVKSGNARVEHGLTAVASKLH